MSLTPPIPSPDDLKRTMGSLPPQLASLRAPQGPMPSLGPLPSLPQQAAPQMPTLRPLVTSPRQQQEQSLQGKISAYENPSAPKSGFWHSLGRVAAKVGNIAGDIVAPGTMSLIPGTDLYKQGEHARNVGELGGLQEQDQKEQQQFADNNLRGAQTREADARADSLETPPDKADKFSFQQTDHGLMRIDNVTGEATPVTFNGQVLQPKVPVEKEVNAKEQLQRQLVEAENKGDRPTVQKLQQQLKDIDPMGQQRLVIQQQNASNAGQRAVDQKTEREYQYTRNKWDKDLATYTSQNDKLTEAATMIGRGAMGDAIGAIKSLSGLASGQGSGVRITQAELNSIAHARGYKGDFDAFLQKFGDGRNLTPAQEKELKGTLAAVQGIAQAKQAVLNKALDDLSNATDTETIRKIDSQVRHALTGGQ